MVNKTALVTVLVIVGIVALSLFGYYGIYYDRTTKLSGEVAQQVLTADEAIRTYEWFKEQEAFIRQCLTNEEISKDAYDEYFARLPENMADWTDFMNKEESGLRAQYVANQKLTNKAIEDYNAKSSMVHKDIFKDLPTNISRSAEDAFTLLFGQEVVE